MALAVAWRHTRGDKGATIDLDLPCPLDVGADLFFDSYYMIFLLLADATSSLESTRRRLLLGRDNASPRVERGPTTGEDLKGSQTGDTKQFSDNATWKKQVEHFRSNSLGAETGWFSL